MASTVESDLHRRVRGEEGDEQPQADLLVCPECGKDDFKNPQARGLHRRREHGIVSARTANAGKTKKATGRKTDRKSSVRKAKVVQPLELVLAPADLELRELAAFRLGSITTLLACVEHGFLAAPEPMFLDGLKAEAAFAEEVLAAE